MAYFTVTQSEKSGEYYFALKAGNHETILKSEGYTSLSACENGIESVKKNAENESAFEKKESKNGKPFFNLKAKNGQVIGTSEMYESNAGMENGIKSVMKNAVIAEVKK